MNKDDIVALEKGFWSGDAEFYCKNLDDRCLVAFTEMSGVMDREAIAGMIREGERWEDVEMTERGFLEPADGVAMLAYEVRASRGGKHHHAVVSSGYVRRNGAWKMAFHQQTPLG
jgi:hypothetical protein